MGKEITEIKDLQKIELDILKFIDKLCRENHLKYVLAYGTLIGAIRHKGFIPWDDDVDILMPRKDYEKFCSIVHKEDGRYKIICCEYDKDYMYAFGKVFDSRTVLVEQNLTVENRMGVYVDVFPYDGIKGTVEENCNFLKLCMFLEKCRGFSIRPLASIKHQKWWKNIFRIPFCYLLKLINYRNITKVLNYFIKKYPVEGAEWVGCLCTPDVFQELMPVSVISRVIEVEFEDAKFYAPIGYDNILRRMYGDYMQLPSVEKRKSHHNFRAWWIEEIN